MAAEDLSVTHRLSLEKYSYFLLAAAGASIGLVINQTQSAKLSILQIPLGLAVTCWLMSFLCGCFHTQKYQKALWLNDNLLDIQRGKKHYAGRELENIEQFIADTYRRFDQASIGMKRFGVWQFRLLISGALFYLSWHILQMYLRT